MKRNALLLLSVFALLAPAAAHAGKGDLTPKNSVDYTMDDGVMSKEEMELEAQDMKALCDTNVYQKKFFKCDCLAGAFLQQREKLGPLVMQHEIFKKITNSKDVDPSCVNTEVIAGESYKSCLSFRKGYAETELLDSTEYCSCVANKVSLDFSKTPRMSESYIQRLRRGAMDACNNPATRAEMAGAAAKKK